MAKSTLSILLKRSFPDAFHLVEALLRPLGLLLPNPANGQVTHWSDDGEQIAISRDMIIDGASAGTVKNVQFWKTSCDDLFVSWTDASPGWWVCFHLNGITPDLKMALTVALSNSILIDFKMQYEHECAFRIDFN